jgi:hypothetical protein
MPLFFQHIEKMMKSWVAKMLQTNEDEKKYNKIEAMASEQETLETNFPEDFFSLFNQQVTLLAQKLKGDMFIRVVRMWMNHLQDVLEEKADHFRKTVKADRILLYPVELNDFNKLSLNLNENRKEIIQYVEGDQVDKVTEPFMETVKVISKSIDKLCEGLVETMFFKLENTAIEPLFQYTQLTQEPHGLILTTLWCRKWSEQFKEIWDLCRST